MNTLRDYQQEIVSRIHEAWKHHRSVMVQMPTGTGKTHVLAEVARSSSLVAKRILIVAHRIELIAQIRETLGRFHYSLPSLVEGQGGGSVAISVESIQTISRRIDSLDFTPDLIVIDEAHHALAKTYRLLWDKWPEARFLGLTATPCRLNGKGFTDLFDVLVSSWSVAEFIGKGVLASFDYASIYPDSEEQRLIDSLKRRGADGDYQLKEMDEVLNKRPSIERLYQSMIRFAQGKKGIVYAISIDHARGIAKYYCQQGIKTVAIDSKMPREERKLLVNDFKDGRIQVLVNVDIFSEGFDCPDVEFVQMARPTLSLAKYLQQVGRGLRKTGGKENCMLIDNVGLYHVFGLPVVRWDWERMFRGTMSYKPQATGDEPLRELIIKQAASDELREKDGYTDMGLVVSHEGLLEKLNEWSAPIVAREEKEQPLKVWQERVTGRYGLRRGRDRLTEAIYNKVYEIREEEGLIAVLFSDGSCGVINEVGETLWKRNVVCQSMKFVKDNFLLMKMTDKKGYWLDLYALRIYDRKPEIKRYRETELLKVNGYYYTRTKRCYTCRADDECVKVLDYGFHLDLVELGGYLNLNPPRYCVLKDDHETYYRLSHRLEDKSFIGVDMEGNYFHVTRDRDKVYVGNERTEEAKEGCRNRIAQLIEQAERKRKSEEEERKRHICKMYREAVPYQSGTEWGLKVGAHITIPPIYKTVKNPVGKYCVVENLYGQWGIVLIEGTVVVKPQYDRISVSRDGKAVLVDSSGKKKKMELDMD